MKIFMVKYCTTKGEIFSYDCNLDGCGDYWVHRPKNGYVQFFNVDTVFLSFDEAVIRAKELQSRKIKSLEKQLEKVKKLEFTEVSL